MTEQLDRIEAMLQKLVPDRDRVPMRWVQLHVVEMLSAMARGNKIEAIKECRTITGYGLKEAKDLICNVLS
jgi:hypothetical protein